MMEEYDDDDTDVNFLESIFFILMIGLVHAFGWFLVRDRWILIFLFATIGILVYGTAIN